MRFAAVVAPSGQLVPLADGPIVKIIDTESLQEETYPNPAADATQHRRAVAVSFLHQQKVDVIATIPGSFCPHSHGLAQRHEMRFQVVEQGVTWADLVARKAWSEAEPVLALPAELLFKHGAGHGHHHH